MGGPGSSRKDAPAIVRRPPLEPACANQPRRQEFHHEGSDLAGQTRRSGGRGARSDDSTSDRCHLEDHLDGDLWLRPASVRGARAVYRRPATSSATSRWGLFQEVGSAVTQIKPGDRVVVPFNISCGHCVMCNEGLQSQCETTQVTSEKKGAALFGYTSLYGAVPGGQAQCPCVYRQAQYGPIKVSQDGPDERYLFLSDILPTAWQAVQYANVPDGGTLVVFGLGPVGQFATRIGRHLGHRVIGIDPVSERRAMAARHGIETVDPDRHRRRTVRGPGDDRRLRRARGDGCGWHGGPRRGRRDGRQDGPGSRRIIAGCVVAQAHRECRGRSVDRPAQRDRCGAPRRDRLDQRRLRWFGRPGCR